MSTTDIKEQLEILNVVISEEIRDQIQKGSLEWRKETSQTIGQAIFDLNELRDGIEQIDDSVITIINVLRELISTLD